MKTYVADTHAVLWFAAGERRRFGRNGRRMVDGLRTGRSAIVVSVVTLWEIAMLHYEGAIRLTAGFTAWTDALENLQGVTIEPLSRRDVDEARTPRDLGCSGWMKEFSTWVSRLGWLPDCSWHRRERRVTREGRGTWGASTCRWCSMSNNRRGLLAIAIAILLAGACSGADLSKPTERLRILDDLCQADGCTTSGSARRTTGLTSDSVGYQLGPGAGSLVMPRPPGDNVSILVRGHGTLRVNCVRGGADCSSEPLPADYDWIDVVWAADGGDAGPQLLDLSVDEGGSEAHLADVRSHNPLACSIAAAGPR